MHRTLFALLLTLALPAHAERALVFAAASATDALQEIGQAFTKVHGHPVDFAVGAFSELARQAVADPAVLPADLYAEAWWRWRGGRWWRGCSWW